MACANCGCKDSALNTNVSYQLGTEACPAGEACDQFLASECVVYSGDDLVDFPLKDGERVEVTLKKLIMYHLDSAALFGSNGIHAPYNVESYKITDTTIQIEWDAVANVTDYTVSIAPGSTGVYTDVTAANNETKHTFINLAPSTTYYIKVTANGIAVNYSSLVISVTTKAA